MGSENEPAKQLLPYLQRADELQKHELLVAYYCRLYAMERGLRIPQKDRTKTTSSILVSLMNQLEKDKKSLKLGPEDNLYVEGFASNVFAKADKQDRAGRADLNTAKAFYAASIFFEILNQFGELQPDLEQKQKYAVWKAAEIRKALKEGRKPVPGPPGGDIDLSASSSSPSTAYDLNPSENEFASHPETGAEVPPQTHEKGNYQNTPTSPPSYPSSIPPSSPSYPTSNYPRDDFHSLPSATNRQENSYSQPYHPQPYQPESPHLPPQNYPSQEFPSSSFSYPNFQSYPGFNDHSLPAAPTHSPYFQGSDVSYPQQSPHPATNYQSTAQYSSTGSNGAHVETASPSAKTFQYDSNYQPPPEKIVEAHKAARFAVGALAFDDVAVAVDFLSKSLELLTNPSANH
ncbi:hypothetical protein IFM89_038873 [Coptis chinensis]|uniref:Uncharacterized protein n=1 Tax=Coptis chinensis TaxID=261450 RepID=A0A835I994_9MAGN|nr:hypothetical protein IFM89_038873 [Coptis chinensis]